MEEKFAEINKLKNYLKQIISLYENKKNEVIELTLRNNGLVNEIEEQKKQITELEKKSETLKIAKTISLTEEDKAEVKNKINKIVREIDKSIGLLNE